MTDQIPQNQSAPNNEAPKLPDWLSATAEDFAVVDLNKPLATSRTIDCSEISDLYQKKSKESAEAGSLAEHRVFATIGALCSFHFKPNERNEPFGPLWRMENSRSPIPDDFRGDLERVLTTYADNFVNPALCARVNDTL
jgi:hypothetical protein